MTSIDTNDSILRQPTNPMSPPCDPMSPPCDLDLFPIEALQGICKGDGYYKDIRRHIYDTQPSSGIDFEKLCSPPINPKDSKPGDVITNLTNINYIWARCFLIEDAYTMGPGFIPTVGTPNEIIEKGKVLIIILDVADIGTYDKTGGNAPFMVHNFSKTHNEQWAFEGMNIDHHLNFNPIGNSSGRLIDYHQGDVSKQLCIIAKSYFKPVSMSKR